MKPMKTLSLAAALLLGTSAFALAASGSTSDAAGTSHGTMAASMANGGSRSAILKDLHDAGYTNVLSLMKNGPMYVGTADKGGQSYSFSVDPKTGKISPTRIH